MGLKFKKIILWSQIWFLMEPNLCISEAQMTLSLKECIDIGIENNIPLKITQKQIELSKRILKEAKRLFYPFISTALMKSTTKEEEFSEEIKNYLGIVKLGYPFLSGKNIKAEYRMAKNRIELYKTSYNLAVNKLILKIKKDFLETWNYKKIVELLDNNVKEIEKEYKFIEELKRKELISKLEFDKWQNSRNYFYLEIAHLKSSYQERLLNLKQTIGLELNTNIELEKPEEIVKMNSDEIGLVEAINLSLKNRLEFIILQIKETIDKDKAISEIPSYKGNIFGEYKWEGKDFPLPETEWNVGIEINIPLGDFSLKSGFTRQELLKGTKPETNVEKIGFDLFEKNQVLQKIKANYFNTEEWLETKTKYYDLEEKVISEVTQHFFRLKVSKTKMEFNREKASLSDKEFEKAQIDYESGRISRIELVEKKIDKIRSNLEGLISESEYQINLLSLEEAIGIDTYEAL